MLEAQYQAELKRIADSCKIKRDAFIDAAKSQRAWSRRLQFSAGAIALLSAASITAILSEITNTLTLKIFSALMPLVSGILSLYTTIFLDEKDMQKRFEAAEAFLRCRDRTITAIVRPAKTEKEREKIVDALKNDYVFATNTYEHLLPRLPIDTTVMQSRSTAEIIEETRKWASK